MRNPKNLVYAGYFLILFLAVLYFQTYPLFSIGVFLLAGAMFWRYRKREQQYKRDIEQKYEPFYVSIETFAQKNGYASERFSMPNAFPVLSKYLQEYTTASQIPFYDPEQAIVPYRSGLVLSTTGARELLVVAPMYLNSATSVYGIFFYVVPLTSATKHWITIGDSEVGQLGRDQKLESRQFNSRFDINGSDPKLVTEVLSPELMERIQAIVPSTLIRFRGMYGYLAWQGTLTTEHLGQLRNVFLEVQSHFLEAIPHYPEPVK